MQVSDKYYDEIFEFNGLWDAPSKCGLKIVSRDGKTYIIVSELYQDNPGTSVTYAGYSLFKQICAKKSFAEKEVVYLECTPDTNSKLSFYNEIFFEVTFPEITGIGGRPAYRQLSPAETKAIFT